MERSSYPGDLTDEQWELVRRMIPSAEPGGRHRGVDMREVLNGILYLVRSGCAWRALPHEFPPRGTVHDYLRRFRPDGSWRKVHDALRTGVRQKAGRRKSPSAAIVDGQTAKTTEKGGHAATTRARRSTDARGTSSWTRRG